jgi:diguanylate cyclase (GGDEF)-like protein
MVALKRLTVPMMAVIAAAATIALSLTLNARAQTAESARIVLAQLQRENAGIQLLQDTEGAAGVPALIIARRASRQWAALSGTLDALSADHPLPQLSAAQRATVVGRQTDQHTAIIAARYGARLKGGAPPPPDVLASYVASTKQHGILQHMLSAASQAFAHQASNLLDQAVSGSALGIAILLGLFLLFYARLQRAQRRAAREAALDPLTGLGNRRRLFGDLASLQRRGSVATIVIIDLDGFKAYNDSLGHQAGDALLCEIAARLDSAVLGAGAAYRLGGDEFCLVLEGLLDEPAVDELLAPVLGDDLRPLAVGMSHGTAELCTHDPEASLRHADERMYAEKAVRRRRAHTRGSPRHNSLSLTDDQRADPALT